MAEPTRWQMQLLDAAIAAAGKRFTVPVGRANGRRAADRFALAAVLVLHGHLHVAARDGLWCVRLTALGALWEQLPRPSTPQQISVTYDEVGDWVRDA